jgi:hypothetical protein
MRQNRPQIEQRLRRMLMHAVARVQHRHPVSRSSSHGAPELGWRRMIASAPSARSVSPVSFSVSPFSMLEERLETSVVSAPNPLAASSKLVRVRVEDS